MTKQNLVQPTNPFIEFPTEDIESSIPARIEAQVARYPEHIAVKTRNETVTYAQLNQLANQIAHTIQSVSSDMEARIGLLFDPGTPLIAAIVGVLKAGRCWVPLDPMYPEDRVKYILEDAQASLILTTTDHEQFANTFTSSQLTVLDINTIDPATPTNNLGLSIPPETISNIMYTSGSTGLPKGVVYTHRVILHNIAGHTNTMHISHQDRLSLFSSFSHLSGMTGIFRALFNGATTFPYNIKKDGLLDIADWLRHEKITIYHSVPTVFRHFLDTLKPDEIFPDIRYIHLGGEPISRQDIEAFKRHFSDQCIIMNNLGSSETGTIARYLMTHETELDSDLVPIGYPAPGREILLLDETGTPVPDGEAGEICVKSDYLVAGYWQQPELTAEKFKSVPNSTERIYHTGDLGRFLPNGQLVHQGRKDFQVKIRGQRVELGEIEATLLTHPDIKELAVVARDNKVGDKHLVAYIVPKARAVPTINALRDFLFERLPQYMVPSTFVFLEALPLLPNGKINRQGLPNVEQTRPAVTSSFVAPRDDLEKQLVQLWEVVLDIQPIGVRDNFFDLGGHSLVSSQLLAQIKKFYGRELPLSTLFQAPTIEQLADLLRQEEDTTQFVSLIPLQPEGHKPPFFCLPGNLGNVYTDLNYLPRYMDKDQPIYGLQDGLEAPSKVEALAEHYLQEIRAKQPEGPYYIGGVCAGGVVAFEMARQLEAEGEKVSLLALIEPAPPRGPSISSYMSFARTIMRRLTRRLGHHASTLTRLDNANQKDYTRLKAKLIANSWALRQYAPKTVPTKMQLFLANDTLEEVRHPRLRWRKFAEAGTAVHELPGNHDTVTGDNDTEIDEQGMQVLARKLQTCIDSTLRNNS